MKNIVIVSAMFALTLSSAAFADIYTVPSVQQQTGNNPYAQQTVNTARQLQNDASNAYQNSQQMYNQGQDRYRRGQQSVRNVKQNIQNGLKQDYTNVQQEGQSYVDKNVQPIRQKSGEMVSTWSNQAADWQAKADANQRSWEQAIRSFENSYNESYSRNWDKMMDYYQKSKKL